LSLQLKLYFVSHVVLVALLSASLLLAEKQGFTVLDYLLLICMVVLTLEEWIELRRHTVSAWAGDAWNRVDVIFVSELLN